MNNKFENIKKNIPELITFLKSMPKGGDLHNHSLGSSYSEFIYEDAIKLNNWYDLERNLFLTNEEYKFISKNKNIISIEEFKNFYSKNMLNHFSMRGWNNNFDGASHFFNTFLSTISSKRDENSMILEIIKRNKLQNIKYIELIAETIPSEIKEIYIDALKNKENFSLENMKKYCEILDKFDTEENYLKIKEFLDKRDRFLEENGEKDFTIKYIPFLTRVFSPLYKFFAEAYLFMLYSIKDERICGINIVEPEDDILSRKNFNTQVKIIKFIFEYLSKKFENSKRKINLSLHAGELNLFRSPLEDMNNRISSTIFLTQNKKEQTFSYTKRIGHGVSIPWEENVITLLKHMAHEKIAVEICLSSNEYILGIKEKDHPFTLYKKYDVPLIICTDDEAVNRSNLTNEYLKAVQNFDLSYKDLKNISRNALEFSFLEGKSLYKDCCYNDKIDEFKNINTLEEWQKKIKIYENLIKDNLKLKKQIELEMDFIKFENFIKNNYN